MSLSVSEPSDELNGRLAKLLAYGTWLACGFIMIGMILSLFGWTAALGKPEFTSTGILLLIALPSVRVATMGLWFLFRRDFEFALIAMAVLAIIVIATFLGLGAA
jgi:uncharacterized membrane protein